MVRFALFVIFSIVLMNPRSSVCDSACPKKCVCDRGAGVPSVQCFRVQAVPSEIPKDVRRVNMAYNHIKDLKVKYKQ